MRAIIRRADSVCLLQFAGDSATVLQIKQAVAEDSGVPVELQRLVDGAHELADGALVSAAANTTRPRELECVVRTSGGKGGFGAMLRSARGGLDAKKTTNFDAMRDLSGRRMRHVNNEKKLKEWIDTAPEREAAAKREALERKRLEAARTRTEAEVTKYASQVESVRETVGQGVAMGIVAAKKRQRAAAAAEAARQSQAEGSSPAAAANDAPLPAKRQRVDPATSAGERESLAGAASTTTKAAVPASATTSVSEAAVRVDVEQHKSASELLAACGAEAIKRELARMGLKCGGTPEARAERLWSTKGKTLNELDPRMFAKKKGGLGRQ